MKASILAATLFALSHSIAGAAGPTPTLTVYKTPTCGCCSKWVDHMKANGFKVVAHDVTDVTPHKQRLGVPVAMGSCHTAEIGGYLIEGHVPASDVKRLLTEKPKARGLVSPGMPQSAPGMDMPGNVPYPIHRVDRDGKTSVYARH